MAMTTLATGLQKTHYEKKFYNEYQRESIFAQYMGKSINAPIQVFEQLGTKKGQTINIPLFTRLTNAAVENDDTLRGNEESLSNYSKSITVKQVRNAVLVGKMEQQHTEISIPDAARAALKMWIADDQRNEILDALGSPVVTGDVAYADATEAQKDAWLAVQHQSATNTRALFGNAVANEQSGDHSASLAQVDSTNDTLDFDIVQLAKRLAKKADPHIRPLKVKGGREMFVLFAESYGYRDLKVDTETIHQNAGLRGPMNKLFTDADLELDGVVVKEVPEIAPITGVGNGSIDVGRHYLCGAQAVGYAVAQKSKFVTDKDIDYENQTGIAVGEIRRANKMMFNDYDHGMVTIAASAVADS